MRGLALFVFVTATLIAPGASLCAQGVFGAQPVSHSELEASYLVNFFKFVQWPRSSGTASICFLKRSGLFERLEDGIAHNQRWTRLEGRQLAVRLLSEPAANEGCQILYLDAQTADELWSKFPVPDGCLTVSDQHDFVHHGGMIEFQWTGFDNFQMAIHRGNVTRSGFIISGVLGNLAERIDAARGRGTGTW